MNWSLTCPFGEKAQQGFVEKEAFIGCVVSIESEINILRTPMVSVERKETLKRLLPSCATNDITF